MDGSRRSFRATHVVLSANFELIHERLDLGRTLGLLSLDALLALLAHVERHVLVGLHGAVLEVLFVLEALLAVLNPCEQTCNLCDE